MLGPYVERPDTIPSLRPNWVSSRASSLHRKESAVTAVLDSHLTRDFCNFPLPIR